MKKLAFIIMAVFALSFIITLIYDATRAVNYSDSLNDDTTEVEEESKQPVLDQLLLELDSDEIYNDSIIYGYWFQPHAAYEVNAFFHKNGVFELKYTDEFVRSGKFVIEGNVILLNTDEGWENGPCDGRLFHRHNGTNFYIADSKEQHIFLVKGSD